MKTSNKLKFTLIVSICLPSASIAALITFDGGGIEYGVWSGSMTTKNMIITAIPGINDYKSITTGGYNCGPPCAYNGTRYLFNAVSHPIGTTGGYTFTKSTEGTFTLLSFDAAESFYNSTHTPYYAILDENWAPTIQVVGTNLSNETVSASFDLDFIHNAGGLGTFETFFLPANFSNLVSLEIFGIGGTQNEFSLDNIDIDFSGNAINAPIPASIWLFSTGLFGLISLGRHGAKSHRDKKA